jgi:hypothetical protein
VGIGEQTLKRIKANSFEIEPKVPHQVLIVRQCPRPSEWLPKRWTTSKWLPEIEKHQIEVSSPHMVNLIQDTKKPGNLWFDTGCKRCVSGPDDHEKMTAHLAKYGLKPIRIDKQEDFIFGDGKTDTSKCAWSYPSFLDGRFVGAVDMAECTVPCPPLFSLKMAATWKCVTNHADKYMYIGAFDVKIPFRNGTPYLDIFDWGNVPNMSSVPEEYHMNP